MMVRKLLQARDRDRKVNGTVDDGLSVQHQSHFMIWSFPVTSGCKQRTARSNSRLKTPGEKLIYQNIKERSKMKNPSSSSHMKLENMTTPLRVRLEQQWPPQQLLVLQ